jgi:DNA-binding transcriptional LysR family regulator
VTQAPDSPLQDASRIAWDDLRYFLAACRSTTLSEAARLLRVSQPTVGRRLRSLEADLGVELFERLPDRLEQTEAGRALLPFAESIELQTRDLVHSVAGAAGTGDSAVRVTAIGSVALFLVGSFHDVMASCQPTTVELIATGQRLNLARREAEIALRMNRVPTRGDLVCRKLGRIAYALYGKKGQAEAEAEPNEAAAFIGHRHNPRRKSQSRWLARHGRDGTFPLRVNDLHLRLEAARAGLGVTILPCHLGDACGDLVRVHPPIDELTEDIYSLIHETRRDNPAIRQVADAMASLIEREQPRLLGRT